MDKIRHIFIPGDEWVYYKIYCGTHVSDQIISSLPELVDELKSKSYIDEWYFIRYYDSDYHLRIRFHLVDIKKYHLFFEAINEHIAPFIINFLINNISIDTYKREIKRYQENLIILVEKLFYHDSECTAKATSLFAGSKGQYNRALFSFCSINSLLDDFKLSIEEKHSLMSYMSQSFYKEMQVDKFTLNSINLKYREYKLILDDILVNNNYLHEQWQDAISKRTSRNSQVINYLIDNKTNKDLKFKSMWNYLHMLNNRIFRSQQRYNEFVVYYFLEKHYRSLIVRQQFQSKANV